MNIEQIKQIAKEVKALNTDYAVTFTHDQLQAFAQAVIRAYVAEQEPKAYVAFADNGNIRIWTSAPDEVLKLADAVGVELTPLYDLKGE